MPLAKLKSVRHEDFCRNYAITNHGTKAAIAAGYSPKAAAAQSSYLLRNQKIVDRIKQLKAEAWQRQALGPDEIRAALARIARFDPRKMFDENGNPKALKDLDDDTALAIQGFEADVSKIKSADGQEMIETVTRKVRTADKARVLELAMREQGMLQDPQPPGAGVPPAIQVVFVTPPAVEQPQVVVQPSFIESK